LKQDYFSVNSEPVLHAEHCREKVQPESEWCETASAAENIRDSFWSEPASCDNGVAYGEWLESAAGRYRFPYIAFITLTAGIIGGIAAVPGVFLAGTPFLWQSIYLVCIGPLVEELMKQSGMIFLLEKRPYMVKYGWQFMLAAVPGALVFASIENIIYRYVYLNHLPEEQLVAMMSFRFLICTSLHLSCSLIAAMGLRRAWRKHRLDRRPVEISDSYELFATAIAIHGAYNFLCALKIISP